MLFRENCSDIYIKQLSSRGTRKEGEAAISVSGEGAKARESVGCTSFFARACVTGGFVRACPRGSSERTLFAPTGNQNSMYLTK